MAKYSVSKRKFRVKNKTHKFGGMMSFLRKKSTKAPLSEEEKRELELNYKKGVIKDDIQLIENEIAKTITQDREEKEELERLEEILEKKEDDIIEHKKEEKWYKDQGSLDTYEMELYNMIEKKEKAEIEIKIQEYRLKLITDFNKKRREKYGKEIEKLEGKL